jgi:hypothetical protein
MITVTITHVEPADQLIGQLERQQALAEELWDLARQQGALVEAGDSEGLLSLLARRQSVTDRFLAAQEGMAALCEACRAAGGTAAPSRERIAALMGGVTRRLEEVLARDEQDRALLDALRARGAQEMAGLGTAREAQRAYVGAHAVTNRFADRTG